MISLAVAENNDVSSEEIETMLRDRAVELRESERPRRKTTGLPLTSSKPLLLKKLGIDEIALVKGQGNYCATFVDLERSKVVDILSERSPEKIMEVMSSWGVEVLGEIEYVSIDLWKPYKSLVEKL